MRDAVLKACKRAKQINKHFVPPPPQTIPHHQRCLLCVYVQCYTDLMDEIPEYWKPQFGLSHSERSFRDSDTHKESDNQNEEEHRVQEPLKSDEMSGQESDEHDEDEEPPRHESESPSSQKTVTEESVSDQPNILTSKPSAKEDDDDDDEEGIVLPLTTPDDEMEKDSEEKFDDEGVVVSPVVGSVDKIKVQDKLVGDRTTHTPVYAKEEVIDPEGSSIAADDRSESDPERSSSSIDVAKDPVDVDACCSERPPSHQDAEKNARIKEERDQCRSSEANPHEDVPYKVDRVDVKQLDKDVEAADSYFPSNHWCHPSHMSAFIDGKRCDALEAIPEGSCEEGESLLWQSLPVPTADVYCIASPRRENTQESPHSLSSHPDPQATQSFWGESPSQLDPRLSSYVSGSLGVDGQKRLDSLEQVLALCSKLYVRGRWHELGHVLNQTARQCLSQVRHDACIVLDSIYLLRRL